MHQVRVIDSHTGGEPTRIVISGGPELTGATLAERRDFFRSSHDRFRSAVVNEPRGSNAMVGALLCEPIDTTCSAAVIFFNNVGYLGMCGHGAIGLGATLAYLGRISPGVHRVETPVGIVQLELHEAGEVTVRNVASHRARKDVTIQVEGIGAVTGDVAWGGNWFFLTANPPCSLELRNLEQLLAYTVRIREALVRHGVTGAHGAEIDHIELVSAPHDPRNHARNFVLCPGKEYDRSPCGTGTSAKLACLFADGKLTTQDVWRQESVIGSVFEGSVLLHDGALYPSIKGAAFINSEATLIFQDNDPFTWGIPA